MSNDFEVSDTSVCSEDEDTCVSHEEEDTCVSQDFEVSDTSVCLYLRECSLLCMCVCLGARVCLCVCVCCLYEKESFTQMLQSAEAEVEQAHATIWALEEVSLFLPPAPTLQRIFLAPPYAAEIF